MYIYIELKLMGVEVNVTYDPCDRQRSRLPVSGHAALFLVKLIPFQRMTCARGQIMVGNWRHFCCLHLQGRPNLNTCSELLKSREEADMSHSKMYTNGVR